MRQQIDFSIILPTRDRPKLLSKLFRSLEETTHNPEKIEIILYLDPNDKESANIQILKFHVNRLILPNDTMGNMTRKCFETSRGKYIILLNDDVIVRTKDWDVILKETFEKYPDDILMVYPNDLYYGKQICCFPILSRKAAILMGNIVPSEYVRHSIDSHIWDIFYRLKKRGFKRAIYLRKVVFEHMNFGIGVEGCGENKVDKSNFDDQNRFVEFSEFRERVVDKLASEIKYFQGNSSPNSKLIKENRTSLFVVCRDGFLYNLHQTLDKIERNQNLISLLDSIIILGKPSQLRSIRVKSKLKQLVQKQSVHTTEFFSKELLELSKKEKSRWILLVDASTELSDDWPFSLLKSANANMDIGIIGTLWLNPRTGRIEQAGIAIFRSKRGVETTQLYQGCGVEEISLKESRDMQIVGLVGSLISRIDFVKVGGIKSIGQLDQVDQVNQGNQANQAEQSGQARFDMVGLCLAFKRLGKRVVIDLNSTIFHSEEEILPREALLKWENELKLDLEEILKSDGFELHKTESSYYIFPSLEKLSFYKNNGDIDSLERLLTNTLEIARTFKGSKEDIDFLEEEISTLRECNKEFPLVLPIRPYQSASP